MTAKDTVRSYIQAVERHDLSAVKNLIDPNARIVGPAPTPIGKDQFVAMVTALLKGFPDWKFHAGDFQEDGDVCRFKMQITGTHRGELTLPFPGAPPTIRATGKSVKSPELHPEYTVKNGKIVAMKIDAPPGGGVMNLVSQLGVSMPTETQATSGRPSAPSHP